MARFLELRALSTRQLAARLGAIGLFCATAFAVFAATGPVTPEQLWIFAIGLFAAIAAAYLIAVRGRARASVVLVLALFWGWGAWLLLGLPPRGKPGALLAVVLALLLVANLWSERQPTGARPE